jgi:AraC-like DNA-binding protein
MVRQEGSVMNQGLETMKALLLELLPSDANVATKIPGVDLVRREQAYDPKPLMYRPEIILLAQGRKNVYVGEQVYTYDANNYFVLTVPLPVVCEALIRPGEPLLGVVIGLDPKTIGEILSDLGSAPPRGAQADSSLYQATLTEDLIDALVRLLRALKSDEAARVLGPLYVKEILYQVMSGEHGGLLKEMAFHNRNLFQISRVIGLIHENYQSPLDVHTLAREAGMSVSAFHSNFRTITSSSPLQYIKNTRLHKARELIQQHGERVSDAALRVGYESASQFSREYKRFFGAPPTTDRHMVTVD